jgi:RNA polymerase sigma-70 factor, ECF subfamily
VVLQSLTVETQSEFAERVQPHLDALYRTALRMTGEGASAEDLVQETFLKAYRGYGQFEPGSNFKAWLFTILTNTYINDYRRRSRAPVVTDFAEVEPEGEAESPHFSAEDVERLADRLGDAAKRALDRLPPEHRLVFLLSTFEDLSYKEISAALAVPIGTVMSRLFRARAVLRRDLADFARQEGFFQEKNES